MYGRPPIPHLEPPMSRLGISSERCDDSRTWALSWHERCHRYRITGSVDGALELALNRDYENENIKRYTDTSYAVTALVADSCLTAEPRELRHGIDPLRLPNCWVGSIWLAYDSSPKNLEMTGCSWWGSPRCQEPRLFAIGKVLLWI